MKRGSRFFQEMKQNPRAAIEATVRAVKHPFPKGELPVRGKFRVCYMMIGSAAVNNVRQIQRYLKNQVGKLATDSFFRYLWRCFSVS